MFQQQTSQAPVLNPLPQSPFGQQTVQNAFNTNSVQNVTTKVTDDQIQLMSVFLSRFTNETFIEDLINVSLYPSDFSTLTTKSSDVVNLMKSFLRNITKEIHQSNQLSFAIPKNIIVNSLKLSQNILEIREDATSRLISYDNITQHFPKLDLHTDRILKNVSVNRIKDQEEFRDKFDGIIRTIQSYNELSVIKKTINHWQLVLSESQRDDASIFTLLKEYKNLVTESYNELSTLKTVAQDEMLEDFMVLSDKKSVSKVVNNLMTFLQSGYTFFKSGYFHDPLYSDIYCKFCELLERP